MMFDNILYEIGVWVSPLLLGAFVWLARFLMKKISNWRKKRILKISSAVHQGIQELIIELRTKIDANRVLIHLFHNGEIFLNGHSLLRCSAVNEAATAGTSRVLSCLQNVSTNLIPEIIEEILKGHKSPAFLDVTTTKNDAWLKQTMMMYGVENMIIKPLYKDCAPVGFLAAHYNADNKLPNTDVIKNINHYSILIEKFLR